jgi:diguanylate cyclase (GGDEF)-like protein/PAS domain S-box-containing protein
VIWISFLFSLENINEKNSHTKIQFLLYIASTIFFISNLIYEPTKVVNSEAYGFVDNLYVTTTIGIVFSIYDTVLFITGVVMIYFQMRNSRKNRIRKQMKVILITSLITSCLGITSDLILPALGIVVFPLAIITLSITTCGIWYAINKYKMMSISHELISQYIFESVNEPIFIVGEDFLVKNSNEASLNVTGYNNKDLKENPLGSIVNFRNFNFNSIIQAGKVINIEVDLHRKNKEDLVCELSATVIYDEYNDMLGIVTLIHDVSQIKNIAKMQKKHSLKLEESNLKLKDEIKDRLIAEDQIRHFIYYDALTELFNRKKMLENINILLVNKNEKFAVIYIDLDNFKNINDKFGHQAGDDILKTVADRLKGIISTTDTISRIGGDEFIIILSNLKSTSHAEKIAADTEKALRFTFIYDGNDLFIGASIGISIYPEHGMDADTLIKNADLAMYEVKNKGGYDYTIYSSKMNDKLIDKLEIKIK